jgi:hypothetical protein
MKALRKFFKKKFKSIPVKRLLLSGDGSDRFTVRTKFVGEGHEDRPKKVQSLMAKPKDEGNNALLSEKVKKLKTRFNKRQMRIVPPSFSDEKLTLMIFAMNMVRIIHLRETLLKDKQLMLQWQLEFMKSEKSSGKNGTIDMVTKITNIYNTRYWEDCSQILYRNFEVITYYEQIRKDHEKNS